MTSSAVLIKESTEWVFQPCYRDQSHSSCLGPVILRYRILSRIRHLQATPRPGLQATPGAGIPFVQ